MDASEKIQRAIIQLIIHEPFFAVMTLRLKISLNREIRKAQIDGKTLQFNPAYVDTLSVDETTGLLAHLIMHIVLFHHTRRKNRDIVLWNMAADYPINSQLLKAGFVLPPKYLLDSEFENMGVEQIYNILSQRSQDSKPDASQNSGNQQEQENSQDQDDKQDTQNPTGDGDPQGNPESQNPEKQQRPPGDQNEDDQQTSDRATPQDEKGDPQEQDEKPGENDESDQDDQDDLKDDAQEEGEEEEEDERDDTEGEDGDAQQEGPGGTGDVVDAPNETGMIGAEAEMSQSIALAKWAAKSQGKLPGDLERLIDDILEAKVDWREALARFVAEITQDDYSWMKPSKRYLYSGLYLPSLEVEGAGKIVFIVDTSQSIDAVILNQAAAEVQDIANTFRIPLRILFVDADVQHVEDIDPDDPIELHPKGGGGTDFRPGFDYIEHNDMQPRAVVYFTDGECDDFPDAPDYPVLWALFGQLDFDPPFGEVIKIK